MPNSSFSGTLFTAYSPLNPKERHRYGRSISSAGDGARSPATVSKYNPSDSMSRVNHNSYTAAAPPLASTTKITRASPGPAETAHREFIVPTAPTSSIANHSFNTASAPLKAGNGASHFPANASVTITN